MAEVASIRPVQALKYHQQPYFPHMGGWERHRAYLQPTSQMHPVSSILNRKIAAPWQYNMLNRGAGGRALTRSETLRKAVIIMSTYEEFMVILTVGLLIVEILILKNKK